MSVSDLFRKANVYQLTHADQNAGDDITRIYRNVFHDEIDNAIELYAAGEESLGKSIWSVVDGLPEALQEETIGHIARVAPVGSVLAAQAVENLKSFNTPPLDLDEAGLENQELSV